eukprot:jgi/Psemu1/255208/estExt_Genewise1Plus.C_1300010
MGWHEIVFEYVCPVGGCLLASSVFAAPIRDLNKALRRGSLGSLNTIPWAVMTGNCLGWCAYAYYTSDPFVLASNLPGLVLSLWLNIGACKLREGPFAVAVTITVAGAQDVVLLRIVSAWAVVLVGVGWTGGLFPFPRTSGHFAPQTVVGILVNINLVFFYGAPLQTVKTVLETGTSDTIHTPTVTMNVINAMFWMSYGFARNDAIIYGPNGVGFLLGIAQCALCCVYPKRSQSQSLYAAAPTADGSPANEEPEMEFATLPPFLEDETISSVVERRVL